MKKMQKNTSVPIDTVDIAKERENSKEKKDRQTKKDFFRVLTKGLVINEYEN